MGWVYMFDSEKQRELRYCSENKAAVFLYFGGENILKNSGVIEDIPGIYEDNPLAGGEASGLVHGIINAFVRFGDDGADVRAVSLDNIHGGIGAFPVNNDIFQVGVCLCDDAFQGHFDTICGVICNGDDCYLGEHW